MDVFQGFTLLRCEGREVQEHEACEAGVEEGEDLGGGKGAGGAGAEGCGAGDGGEAVRVGCEEDGERGQGREGRSVRGGAEGWGDVLV